MLIKFFISLRKNWFGSEGFLVACMKIAFFAIFDPTCGPTFGRKKAQVWSSLNRISILNPLERQKLYYY